jgi:hypothetical protein
MHHMNGRTVDDAIAVALGSWLAHVAGSCTAWASIGNIDARIYGKFIVTDAVGFVELKPWSSQVLQ